MPLKTIKVKGSRNWYVRGTVARVGIFESTRTREWGQAEAYRIRLEGETWNRAQLGLDTREPVSFAYAAASYIEITGNTKFMMPVIDYFVERPIDQIGQEEIDRGALKVYPGTKASTRVRMFYTPVLAVLNHAADLELPGAGRLKIKRPKIERVAVQWNTDSELGRLLPHCNDRLAALVLFMTDTGVRISEALRLLPDAFTRSEGFAYVGKTKTRKPRMVPLASSTLAAISRIMPKKPFDRVFGYKWRTSVNTALARACRRAGLARTSPHRVGRHSFAARLLGAGHSLKVVQEAGGWETITVVANTYGHLERSHAHKAMLDAAQQRGKSVKLLAKRFKITGK